MSAAVRPQSPGVVSKNKKNRLEELQKRLACTAKNALSSLKSFDRIENTTNISGKTQSPPRVPTPDFDQLPSLFPIEKSGTDSTEDDTNDGSSSNSSSSATGEGEVPSPEGGRSRLGSGIDEESTRASSRAPSPEKKNACGTDPKGALLGTTDIPRKTIDEVGFTDAVPDKFKKQANTLFLYVSNVPEELKETMHQEMNDFITATLTSSDTSEEIREFRNKQRGAFFKCWINFFSEWEYFPEDLQKAFISEFEKCKELARRLIGVDYDTTEETIIHQKIELKSEEAYGFETYKEAVDLCIKAGINAFGKKTDKNEITGNRTSEHLSWALVIGRLAMDSLKKTRERIVTKLSGIKESNLDEFNTLFKDSVNELSHIIVSLVISALTWDDIGDNGPSDIPEIPLRILFKAFDKVKDLIFLSSDEQKKGLKNILGELKTSLPKEGFSEFIEPFKEYVNSFYTTFVVKTFNKYKQLIQDIKKKSPGYQSSSGSDEPTPFTDTFRTAIETTFKRISGAFNAALELNLDPNPVNFSQVANSNHYGMHMVPITMLAEEVANELETLWLSTLTSWDRGKHIAEAQEMSKEEQKAGRFCNIAATWERENSKGDWTNMIICKAIEFYTESKEIEKKEKLIKLLNQQGQLKKENRERRNNPTFDEDNWSQRWDTISKEISDNIPPEIRRKTYEELTKCLEEIKVKESQDRVLMLGAAYLFAKGKI